MNNTSLYLKQMELGPMQNYVYLSSEGGSAPLPIPPPGEQLARAKPALEQRQLE